MAVDRLEVERREIGPRWYAELCQPTHDPVPIDLLVHPDHVDEPVDGLAGTRSWQRQPVDRGERALVRGRHPRSTGAKLVDSLELRHTYGGRQLVEPIVVSEPNVP